MSCFDGRSVAVGVGGLETAEVLRRLGSTVVLLEEDAPLPEGVTLLVATDSTPRDLAPTGVEVFGETELAWRLRGRAAAPWLVLTGSAGVPTTARMLAAILAAAGAVTGTGTLLERVLAGTEPDALVVEVGSRQLHWSSTLRPFVGCLLNLDPDQGAWHGSFEAYARASGRLLQAGTSIGFSDDAVVRDLQDRATGQRVSFTLQTPRVGELGVVEHLLVDRAFPDVEGEATALGTLDDVRLDGDHHVAHALAAAAVARCYGVPAEAVAAGLRSVEADHG